MADSYSDNNGLILMQEGTHTNEWGDLTNLNLDRLDIATRGVVTIALSGAKTLTANDITSTASTAKEEGFYHFIEFTGTAGVVTVPAENVMWVVRNSTASGTLTITPSGGTGAVVAQNRTAILVYGLNGTTMVDVSSELSSVQNAAATPYNNATSGLSAVDVQAAIDEVEGRLDTEEAHNHTGVYEPAFTKNTGFNKNLGTTVGTVSEGNHNHDGTYATASHNHSGVYAAASHNHSGSEITSGTVAAARLGSGTSITSKFLRGDNTWQTISTTPPTSLGAVGTYGLFGYNVATNTDYGEGTTVSGSNLKYLRPTRNTETSAWSTCSLDGTSPSGTWRVMNYMSNDLVSKQGAICLAVRIS